jgi:GT2 family glycosyltransferase
MTIPRIFAIIVNFRTGEETIRAVQSLKASTVPVTGIIVVDNGSDDGSGRRLSKALAGCRVMEEPTNRGFPAGCNIGIRSALDDQADCVLLLNPDATVSPTALAEMLQMFAADPQVGIVGPVVVRPAPNGAIESFGISYSLRSGRMRNLDFGRSLSSVDRVRRRDVDAVSGCAMLIKRAVFDRIGFLHEDYFFGFEDIDFCLRARAVGFQSAVVSALVEHEGHASIGRASTTRTYFATRNHLLLAQRSSGSQSIPRRWFQTMSILGLNFAHALRSPEVSRLGSVRAFVLGARDHFAGRYGGKLARGEDPQL